MRKIDGIAVFFLTFFACLPLLHADSSFYEKAKGEGKVVLYTSLAGSDVRTFKAGFEKKYPGIGLEIFRTGGPKVLQKVMAEHLAGRDAADVVMTQGPVIHVLVEKKVFASFNFPERKAFEKQFKDTEGYWTDVYPTVHSMAYNTAQVANQDIPRHYTDLLLAKWKGNFALNTNNYMFLAAMRDLYGKEKGMGFLKKLAAQDPQVRTGGTLTATLVAAGEFPLAVSINANNIENVKEKGGPVDWARVEEPYYGEPHPAGVMAKAPHPNAARLLVEFCTSREGQTLIRDLGKVPARSDVKPKIGIDRNKLRILDPEEQGKTTYYRGLFDDLFVKAK
jgi:iron(III) transport system substrate-binding protein